MLYHVHALAWGITSSGARMRMGSRSPPYAIRSRWVDAPSVYGPRKTLYNRYVRWAAKGVWVNLFHALSHAGGPSAQLLIDSSAVKAHRSASGAKRMARPVCKRLAI